MVSNNILHVPIAFMLLFSITTSLSSKAPETSPIPPPEIDSDDSPSDSPSISSPMTFSPADLSPTPVSGPSSDTSPAPAPEVFSDSTPGNEATSPSARTINGGKKAGIAIGVVAGACVVGLGGLLCKKRKQNVQQVKLLGSYSAREDFL